MKRSSDTRRATGSKARSNGRWKRALQNAGLTTGVIVLLLAGVEVVLRSVFDGKYGKRPSFFVPAPTVGWQCTAGLDDTFSGADFRIHVRTDEYGYRLGRLGEVDFRKRLVVLAGDSNVFGWGVSTGETMASYLDEMAYDASGGEARSSLHLVNLFAYAVEIVEERRASADRRVPRRDGRRLVSGEDLRPRKPDGDSEGDAVRVVELDSHAALRSRNEGASHRRADGVSNALREAVPTDTSAAVSYGRLLDPAQYPGQVLNDHTGGHYTPEFNKAWAGKIYELLRSEGVELSGR
jgi:hypothetical protein